ncbi:2,3-bisphosphoglycerate-dependent phosphoglycerate mutase [Candidatus Nanobsidianus stetteri]|uniref:2,3-bisphosphoglycerate-dependent phosphoglycerate mutase n=1 Tax=Nanobsidianus stetteri TaxID=1294122 RepID=A0A2T9WM27_NANST|nr:2,3-bisphosphoglycerate-dependent phosphoglycerate mutase [Candidatus Nanobsidianus stetteri]MCC5446876.1 2,3-bisphosphoglycerate-dependent phosphoglycerate mutase [Candidatus Nanobsidianus stetteri]
MPVLCLIRHGESLWNKENRFTGWVDVPLTDEGREQAKKAGEILKSLNIKFDIAYTSLLSRAIEALEIIIRTLGYNIPVIKDVSLNERHYGDLQGLNKDKVAEIYGKEQVKLWRRSLKVRPPNGESLEDTQKRTIPFFERAIKGDLELNKNVLVVAHGNSLRSIVSYIENLNEEQILNLEIEPAVPILYDYDINSKKFYNKRILKI